MSEPLVVATPFGELGELSEHFAQRVDGGRLMLPYPTGVDEGLWVQFQVLYADGSVAIEGTGKVSGAYDNGEEHPPEYRFDIVLEELTLDGTSEVVFERIVVARESMMSADPGTGEVSIGELEAHAEAAEAEVAIPEEPAAEEDAFDIPEASADVPDPISGLEAMEDDDVAEVAAPARAPAAAPAAAPPLARAPAAPRANPGGAQPPPGSLPTPHSFEGGVLTRPVLPPAWEPTPEVRPDAAASTGLFDYTGGLPKPAKPPRPEIADEARVGHAPAPAPAG